MERSPNIDHLADHLQRAAASIQLRACALAGASREDGERWLMEIVAAQARIDERTRSTTLAAQHLIDRLALSETEQQVMWLLAAIAMRRDVRALVGRCSAEVTPDPSIEAIRSIVYGDRPSWEALDELDEAGTLRSLGVIERSDRSAEHETRQTWALSSRVLAWLHGRYDPRVGRDVGEVPNPVTLAVDAASLADTRAALSQEAITIIAGLPGLGRRTLVASLVRDVGGEVLELDTRRVAVGRERETIRGLALECRLLDRTPLLTHLDLAADAVRDALEELLPLFTGAVAITSGAVARTIRSTRAVVIVELRPPSARQRAAIWEALLGRGASASEHADRYAIAPALISRVVAGARARTSHQDIADADIAASVRAALDERLAGFARRVDVTQTWDDVVLGAEQGDAILELLGRVRGRTRVYEDWGFARKVGKGLGVTALFSGPPGTGKTMVASLVAKELGLELYQVDMSRVVSKYIGESERNLAQLFDAAEAGQALLLFDEADALFAKRTQVKSSNDRYANLETNYLLQRFESYTGVCILTSNHDGNIDPAFQRRLSLHLRFELPEVGEREQLWRTLLSCGAPVARDVDLVRLATRFDLSGGHIRNAALGAAFVASGSGGQITMAMLESAARAELRSLGKLLA